MAPGGAAGLPKPSPKGLVLAPAGIGEAAALPSKDAALASGSSSNGVSPAAVSIGSRPGASSSGVNPGPLSSGIKAGDSSTGTSPGASSSGVSAGASSSGTKPGASSSGARPGASSSGARPGASSKGARPGAASGRGASPGCTSDRPFFLVDDGMLSTTLQAGHFTFLPATFAGIRSRFWQPGQRNWIFADGFVSVCGAPGDSSGIWTTSPQLGHFPFLPAAETGVRTGWLHLGHGNSILSLVPWLFVPFTCLELLEPLVGAAGVFACWADADGMSMVAPQLGHFPFLPAAASGVRIKRPQF